MIKISFGFWLLKHSLMARTMRITPVLFILDSVRGNRELLIQKTLAELLVCRNPDYAAKLLHLLSSSPQEYINNCDALKKIL